MLAHKYAERCPVSNTMTMTLLVTLFGAVVSRLLIALVPVRKRITIDVEPFAYRQERATRLNGFNCFFSQVSTVGCWHLEIVDCNFNLLCQHPSAVCYN